jgi:hypothetical protein
MPMVPFDSSAAGRTSLRGHRMSIVEADQAFAALAVQGEAVAQSMRTFGARFNPLDDELDEMLAGRVGKKYLPVEKQKGVKTLIMRFSAHIYVIMQ